MKILYATSEAVPFIKTGGLADVAGSLPPALAEEGAEVAQGSNFPTLTIGVSEAKGTKCPRCWMHAEAATEDGLCPRCAGVIAKLEVEI